MDTSHTSLLRAAVDRYRTHGFRSLARVGSRYLISRVVTDWERFVWQTRYRYAINRMQYKVVADPWNRLWIDPQRLVRANYELPTDRGLGLIRSGTWDCERNVRAVDEYWSVRGLKERFNEGLEWRETSYVSEAKRRLEETGSVFGYRDLEAFLQQRCEFIDELHSEMTEYGYRPNAPAGHTVPETNYKQRPHQQLDVLVCIDRGGEILLRDGHHRIALAQILDIERVPVHVIGRHHKWQRIRDASVGTQGHFREVGNPPVSCSHPDLVAVRKEFS